jgi:hypothetical protein
MAISWHQPSIAVSERVRRGSSSRFGGGAAVFLLYTSIAGK